MVQGELFIDENEMRSGSEASFLSKNQMVLRFDKLVLISIGILVLFVFTYSFGYEQGRRVAERKMEILTAQISTVPSQNLPAAQPAISADSEAEQITISDASKVETPETSLAEAEAEPEADQDLKGKYTIQIATALSEDRAQKEVEKLKTKGLRSFFVQRGRYFEVCVGAFETVANAKPILNEFKTNGPYGDAFVRMNPHV